MAKDITKELLATIKQTLPETQVGLIKEALNERDELKTEVEDLNGQVKEEKDKRRELFEDFTDLDKKYKELTDEHGKVVTENGYLKTQNEDYKLKDVERRAAEAEAELRGVQTTQQLFLKNTIVREKIQHQVTDESPNMVNQYTPQGTVSTQQGVYKTNRPVTDVKETDTDTEAETKG